MEATAEAMTLIGRSLLDLEASLEATRRLVEEQQDASAGVSQVT